MPSSTSNIDLDTQFDKGICCGNCREKSNVFLAHGLIKYIIDQIEILREEIKAKNKIIDLLLMLKLSLLDEQNFLIKMFKLIKALNKVDNKSVFHNYMIMIM